MIREIIVPREKEYILKIPEKYLNRKVEILLLPIDIESNNKTPDTNINIIKKTAGLLKNKNIDPFKWQQNIRADWDNR